MAQPICTILILNVFFLYSILGLFCTFPRIPNVSVLYILSQAYETYSQTQVLKGYVTRQGAIVTGCYVLLDRDMIVTAMIYRL